MEKLKSYMVVGCLGLAVLGVVALIYYLFYLLSFLVTSTGSVIAFAASFYFSIRLIVKVLIFPGSFGLWKRSLEVHFCKEMSAQLLQKASDLQLGLQVLLNNCSASEKESFLSKQDCCLEAKRMVEGLITQLSVLKEENKLTKYQSELLELLLRLQNSIEEIGIVGDEVASLWEWFEEVRDEADWVDVVFEDFPYNTAAKKALKVTQVLKDRLMLSCGKLPLKQSIQRWFSDTTFGNLDQMRVELKMRFPCEEVKINELDW